MNTGVEEQFRVLRGRIENALAGPAIVTITSAQSGDGKSYTAFGLAEAFVAAGYSVAILDVNHINPELAQNAVPSHEADDLRRMVRRSSGHRIDEISLGSERLPQLLSRKRVGAIAARLRATYDFVFVDTAPATHSNVASLFSAEADGTLVTARAGRPTGDNDRRLMEICEAPGLHCWASSRSRARRNANLNKSA